MHEDKLVKLHDKVVNNLVNLMGFEKISSFEDYACAKEDFDYHKGWICVEREWFKLTFLRKENDVYIYTTCIRSDDENRIGISLLIKPRAIKYILYLRCLGSENVEQCIEENYRKFFKKEFNIQYLINELPPFTYNLLINGFPILVTICRKNENYEDENVKCMFNLKKLLELKK